MFSILQDRPRNKKPPRKSLATAARKNRFFPRLEVLEDRITPDGSGSLVSLPDLVVSVTSPLAVGVAGPFDVSYTVTNQGLVDAPLVYEDDAVYLSADTTLDASDIHVGDASYRALFRAGDSNSHTATLSMPSLPAGIPTWYVLVATDADNAIAESDETNNLGAAPLQLPDLAISFANARQAVAPGDRLQVDWTVTNQGDFPAAASFWQDFVLLSDDPVPDAGDTLLGLQNKPSGDWLAPGSSYSARINNSVPDSTPLGNKYLIVVTDYYSWQAESDRTNNVWVQPLTIARPDLVVSVTSPLATGVGGAFDVSYTVTNQSAADTRLFYDHDAVYLSTDTTLDAEDIHLGDVYSPAVFAAGVSSSHTATLSMPSLPAEVPSWYVLVATDADNAIAESDETNNLGAAPLQLPDLVVASVNAPQAIAPGEQLHVNWTVANQGDFPAAASFWQDFVLLSDDPVPDAGDTLLGLQNKPERNPLAPGSSYSSSIEPWISASTPLGNKYLIVVTDYYASQAESDETNNDWVQPLTITRPDLVVSQATAPAVAGPGEQINISWTVTNQGDIGPQVLLWYDDVYFSEDALLGPSDTLLTFSAALGALPPGDHYTSPDKIVTIPVSMPGTCYLLFAADGFNDVTESNETNNVRAVPITIARPDLAITDWTAPRMATPGEQINLSWTVTNQGPVTTTGSRRFDTVYLSDDVRLDDSDVILSAFDTRPFPPLAPGASYTNSQNGVLLPSVTPGNKYLLFVSDRDNNVAESDETNNVQAVPITLTLPDLVVSAVDAPATIAQGGTVPVSWTVENQGTVPALANFGWFDTVFLSADSVLDSSDTQLLLAHSGTSRPFAAGSRYTHTQDLFIPGSIPPGVRYLLFQTDALFAQTESDETNNVRAVAITVVPADVDLIVTSATAPASAVVQDTITVSWTVTNQGTTETTADWIDSVYLSEDQILDGSDTPLGGRRKGGALAAGDSYTVSCDLPLTFVRPGNKYLLIVADGLNTRSESDENNNVRALPFRLLPPGIDLTVSDVVSPDSTLLGDTIDVSWTVTNRGDLATTAAFWFDYLYLSNDPTLGGSDYYLGEKYVAGIPPLASGASYTQSSTVTLPAYPYAAYKYLLVGTDRNDGQMETDETNNVRAVPIHIALPDLAVTAASAPDTGRIGEWIPVSWTIANQGDRNTQGYGWHDQILLSEDATPDASDTILADTLHQNLLAAGASYTINQYVNIWGSLTSAPRYLLFVTDRFDSQVEGNETNNLWVVPITISGADLAVETATAPPSAAVGSLFTVSWTVANRGDADTIFFPWLDSVYLSRDAILDASDQALSTLQHDTAVSAGDSYDVRAYVFIPTSVSVGTRYLLFTVDPNNRLAEADESNNVLALPISITGENLAIASTSAPATAHPGDTIPLSWTVTNQGTSDTNGIAWTDEVYLSDDRILDYADQLLASTTSYGPVSAGATYSLQQNVTFPAWMSPGPRYLLFVTDRYNTEPDLDRTNNVAAVAITLTPPEVDLVVSDARAPATAAPGQAIPVTWTITNEGTEPVTLTWYDGFRLSEDDILNPSDTYLIAISAAPAVPLTAGHSYTQTFTLDIPWWYSRMGSQYLLIVADSFHEQPETNEVNNVRALPIFISNDLTPPVLTVPTDIVAEAAGPAGSVIDFTVSAWDDVDGPLTPVCEPASGSTFALGTTTVTCSATDAAGNTATASFAVTVVDTTPPTLTLPGSLTAEATGPTGAVITYDVSAADVMDGAVLVNCVPASGSMFALGTTIVSASATDNHGNTATGTFAIRVVDTTAPVVTAPADQTVEASSGAGAIVTFAATATDAVTTTPTVHYYEFYGRSDQAEVVSGRTFTIGVHHLTAVATDGAGNISTATFNIMVVDTTAPVITAPASMTVAAIDAAGAPVTYPATATDLVDGPVSVSGSPASGSIFALGSTTVGLTAVDSHGNTATASFLVMVVDITPPVLTLNGPNTLTLNQGATFTDPGATAIDNVDGDLTVNIVEDGSVNTSRPGDYTLTCSVRDHAGNTASATRTVTVTPARTLLTVTVDSSLMLVGSTPLPTLTGTVSGLVPGDSVTVVYSTIATASSPVGMYPITADVSGSALVHYQVTVTPGTLYIVSLGADTDPNAQGGGRNVAFWDNKGNQVYVANLANVWTSLDTLNLVKQNGTTFDPTNVSALDSWLQKANAQNAAYWLSTQLAAADLNVLSWKVLAGDIVYAGNLLPYGNACNLAGHYGLTSGGFITVQNLMNAANDALGLYLSDSTRYSPYGGSDFRNYLMALAQALLGVNNNTAFIQLLPTMPTMAELDALFASHLLS